ncbi:aminoacyl--tRNA ligase-related protein [Thermasporomyces composti]|jgi:threonyl-tRNA synthetase|uniref:threonine--tRNA ligase n=1 Tax=Thermasporomyces composti TaxID=696763 RepID=A0A3D9VAF7_THECX|nr:aminoacyl--tRNA ligase-related protein [Thermasporomyces composti]REF35134.1 threonyl-tRNA synthetase [Thermasporomyces composti]
MSLRSPSPAVGDLTRLGRRQSSGRPSDQRSPDHRRLGRELGIFTGDELIGAGFPLWLPDGATVIAELERFVIELERRSGYRHVRTPPVGRRELYERSGHWAHFAADMFPPIPVGGGRGLSPGSGADDRTGENDRGAGDDTSLSGKDHGRDGAREDLVLRPVLCPHHALVYRSRLRSHRDLPLRVGECGQMFRMERSGVVTGLSRVRCINLNDGHIFCAPEQAVDEVARVLALIDEAYDVLGIEAAYLRLSLRGPDEDGMSFAPGDAMWQAAEGILRQTLDRHGLPFQEAPGEAAFYGPKIDVQVYDVQGREFTLSTVQVDLYQPQRFELEFVAPDGSRSRPVMVHRSVLASMERMVAFLLERYAGALPPWLAPLQVLVLPVSADELEWACAVARMAEAAGLRVDVDDREESLAARIRDAHVAKVPYVAVVGPTEVASGAVAPRLRGGRNAGVLPADRFVAAVRAVVATRRSDVTLDV